MVQWFGDGFFRLTAFEQSYIQHLVAIRESRLGFTDDIYHLGGARQNKQHVSGFAIDSLVQVKQRADAFRARFGRFFENEQQRRLAAFFDKGIHDHHVAGLGAPLAFCAGDANLRPCDNFIGVAYVEAMVAGTSLVNSFTRMRPSTALAWSLHQLSKTVFPHPRGPTSRIACGSSDRVSSWMHSSNTDFSRSRPAIYGGILPAPGLNGFVAQFLIMYRLASIAAKS